MTTTEAPSGSCARCAAPRRPRARFCPACGTRLPDVPITLASASIDPLTAPIPLPRVAPDAATDTASDAGTDAATDPTTDTATDTATGTGTDAAIPAAARPRRGATGLVVACTLVTIAAVVTTVALLVGAPAPVTTPTPVAAPASAPAPAPIKTRARVAPPAGAVPVVGWSGWTAGGTGYGTARPSELDTDGDDTGLVEDITWQSWGGATATGRGTATWVPPTGSLSDGVEMPAVVVASDLGDCHGRLGYRTVGWYFPGKGETAVRAGNDRICRAP